MNGNFSRLGATGSTLAAIAALLGGMGIANNLAVAQQTAGPPDVREEITVIAPKAVNRQVVGRSSTTGAPIELLTVEHRVGYADLDLTKESDQSTLKQRIADAAKAACKDLDTQYPEALYPAIPSGQDCAKVADEQGQTQARIIITATGIVAAANKR